MASAQDQIGLIMQLRRRGIRDNRVLRAIERVPRVLKQVGLMGLPDEALAASEMDEIEKVP